MTDDPLQAIAAALTEALPGFDERRTFELSRDAKGRYMLAATCHVVFGRSFAECIEALKAEAAKRAAREQQQATANDALAKWDALAAQHGWSGPDEAARALAGEGVRT